MTKKTRFFVLLAIVLLLTQFSSAFSANQPISVSVENVVPSIKEGGIAEFNAVIFNDYSETVSAVLTISGPSSDSWVLPYDYSVTIPSGEYLKIPLKIKPLLNSPGGNYAYNLLVQYRIGENPWENLNVAPTLIMNLVQEKTDFVDPAKIIVSIFDEKASYSPGESIQTQVQIHSIKQIFPELDITLQLLDSQERPVYSYTAPVTSQKEPIKPLSQTIPLGQKLIPGTYHIVATLSSPDMGKIASARKTIGVSEVRKLDEKKATSSGLFSRKTTIHYENVGNVPVGGTISEKIYWYEKYLLTADPAPNIVPAEGGMLSLIWTFDGLKAGEKTRLFTYSVSYLPAVLLTILAAILILLAWQRIRAVSVSKEVIKQRISQDVLEATISIHIRNNTEKELSKVVLTDYVPKLAKPVEFGTMKPSETRADKVESALIWPLETLKGGEERVITYKIRTTVGVLGSIDLPAANVRFLSPNGREGFVRSNTAECGRNV